MSNLRSFSSSSCLIPKVENHTTKRTKNSKDRFLDLPTDIIYHILSFLDMKQVAQTSVLSKKWRHVWQNVRILTFDEGFWRETVALRGESARERLRKFWCFIDNVLKRRQGFDIHTLTIKRQISFVQQETVDSLLYLPECIVSAFRSNVQVLRLSWFRYLKSDTISLAARLKTLHLMAVCFSEPRGNDVLILNSQILVNLIIEECCYENIRCFAIFTPSLKHLKVQNFRGMTNSNAVIQISAPELTSLVCKGSTYLDYNILDDLSFLLTAEIDTRKFPGSYLINFKKLMNKILQVVHNATHLTLSAQRFQMSNYASDGQPNMLHGVPILCERMQHLKLTGWRNDSYIHSIARLLQSFPNLETLILERKKVLVYGEYVFMEEDWDAQLSVECNCSHLKSIEIYSLEGCENEVKFLQFLLKGATALEKLTITSKDRGSIVKLRKKIRSFTRSSSVVTVIFSSAWGSKLMATFE